MSVECLIILSMFVRYYKSTIMENQQLYSLSREQLQVFLTAKIGDGGIYIHQIVIAPITALIVSMRSI